MVTVGSHCILELFDCPRSLLNDEAFIRKALRDAVEASGATLLGEVAHAFEPQGVTAIGLLAESHIAIHTWPEIRYAAADIFTCGDKAVPERACARLAHLLKARRHTMRKIARGPAVARLSEAAPVAPAAASRAVQREEPPPDEEDDPCPEPSCAPISGSRSF